MTGVVANFRPGPVTRGLVVSAATAAAVTLPAILMFSWLAQSVDMTNVAMLPSIAIGLSMAFVVLAIPATAWAWIVAQVGNQPARPIIRTTLRVALPTFAVVGIAVDLSQFFIDYVWLWHRLAVHGLFALSFAVGMAVFLGIVTWRVTRVMTQVDEPASVLNPGRISQRVALATGLGVVAGALIALPLDWAVVAGMGRQMLAPLYLVLATGTCAGGFAFGVSLSHFDRLRQRGESNQRAGSIDTALPRRRRSSMNSVSRLAVLVLAGTIFMTFASIPDGPIGLWVAILVGVAWFAWKVTGNLWPAVARGAAGGAVAGVLILAPGWRAAMRIVSIMEPTSQSVFSISGTLGVIAGAGVLIGGVMGIIGALIGLAAESRSRRAMGTILGALVTGFLVVHPDLGQEFAHRGGGLWINLLLFGVVAISYGLLAMAVTHRIGRRPQPQPQARRSTLPTQ